MDADLSMRIEAAAACLQRHGASAVYVYGSVTKRPLRDVSDVDMAVTGLPANVFFRAMAEASRIVGMAVDLVALDRGDAVAAALLASGDLRRVA